MSDERVTNAMNEELVDAATAEIREGIGDTREPAAADGRVVDPRAKALGLEMLGDITERDFVSIMRQGYGNAEQEVPQHYL